MRAIFPSEKKIVITLIKNFEVLNKGGDLEPTSVSFEDNYITTSRLLQWGDPEPNQKVIKIKGRAI